MARADERPVPVVRDLRQPALAHLAEGHLRLQGVEGRERVDRVEQGVGLPEDGAAELSEQPLDFAPLFGREHGQVVVRLDDLERFDEDRLARARAVVDDSRHAASRGGQDGEAVAVVAHHDDGVPERLVPFSEDLLELPRHFGPAAAQLRARARERRGCVVAQQSVRAEEPGGVHEQRVENGQAIAAGGKVRRIRLREKAADRVARSRRLHDRAEFLGRARAAGRIERGEQGSEVFEAAEGKAAVADPETDGFVGLVEQTADLGFVAGGGQRQNGRPSGRRSGQGRNEAEDDAELEGFPVGAVSVSRSYGVARLSSESLRSIFFRAWIILRLRLALGFS